MLNSSNAGTVTFRASAALLLSLVLCLMAGVASPVLATAHSSGGSCSTAGLHYSEKRAGVKYSNKVVDLEAKAVTCATARSIASQVAQDLLREVTVPRQINGLNVSMKESCAGCTPITAVTARSGKKSVTFTVQAGV